jgi:hypothetical protein
VEAGTNFDAQYADHFDNRLGAADGPRRSVKGCEDPISGRTGQPDR